MNNTYLLYNKEVCVFLLYIPKYGVIIKPSGTRKFVQVEEMRRDWNEMVSSLNFHHDVNGKKIEKNFTETTTYKRLIQCMKEYNIPYVRLFYQPDMYKVLHLNADL